jgi:hypothetical protein
MKEKNMRNILTTATLAAALFAAPAIGFAAPQAGSSTAKPPASSSAKPATSSSTKPAAKATIATHSTTGTVKSVDASTLVITHSGKKAEDMTFTLNSSTQKEGDVAVGAPVSVRYHDEGGAHVAAAIVAKAPKGAAAKPKKS